MAKVVKEPSQDSPGSALRHLAPFDVSPRQVLSPRQEIDLIQLNTFYRKLNPPSRTTLLHRIVFRLDQHFLGRPLKAKIYFITHTFKFNFQRVGRIVKARLQRVFRPSDSALRVAVHGTGSLGDFFSHLMFIQEFSRQFGPMEVDFYAHPKKIEDAKFLFGQISFIRRVLNANFLPVERQTYDLVVHLRYLVKYSVENQENVLRHDASLLKMISEADARLVPYKFIFDNHPFLDGLFARGLSYRGMNLADVVGYLGNIAVDRNTFPVIRLQETACAILEESGLVRKRYITVHDGFDTSYLPSNGTVTKCWPKSHWQSLISSIKARFPDVRLVQVGSFNAHLIDGVDLDLRSKTTLDELAWVIKNSLIHVDGESGLVRLAHALHTKSVVIFGPTSKEFFQLDQNINISAGTCNDCWWSTPDWQSRCPRGLATPECMEAVTPAMVFEQIAEFLEHQRPTRYKVCQLAGYDGGPTEGLSSVLGRALTPLEKAPAAGSELIADLGKPSRASWQWAYLKAYEFIGSCAKELDRPLKIADLGGGAGSLSNYLAAALAAEGHDVEVFDMTYFWDRHRDHRAEHQVQKWASSNGFNISYGSVFNVPAENEAYDIVLSISALGQVLQKEHAVTEALRLLNQDGKLFLSFYFNSSAVTEQTRHTPQVEDLTSERLRKLLDTLGICAAHALPDQIHLGDISAPPNSATDVSSGITAGSLVISKAA